MKNGRINRAIWRTIAGRDDHSFYAPDIDSIASQTLSEPREVLSVVGLLSGSANAFLRMELRANHGNGPEVPWADLVVRLRAWQRDGTMSEQEWQEWASSTLVRWLPSHLSEARR